MDWEGPAADARSAMRATATESPKDRANGGANCCVRPRHARADAEAIHLGSGLALHPPCPTVKSVQRARLRYPLPPLGPSIVPPSPPSSLAAVPTAGLTGSRDG